MKRNKFKASKVKQSMASIVFEEEHQVSIKVGKQSNFKDGQKQEPAIFVTKDIEDINSGEIEVMVDKIKYNKHWKQRNEYVKKEVITEIMTEAKNAMSSTEKKDQLQ